jgi:CRP/FNR family transcriptional regulator, cyclic AMP receptor protein
MNAIECSGVPVELKDVAGHAFLRGLSEKQLQALADCAMRIRFNAGDLIFRHGDPANRFYLLIKGKVAVEAEGHDGQRRVVVQAVGAGDVLGWSWLFPPFYMHFDGRAVETTEAIFLYGTRLREMCEDDHDLGYEILKRIAKVVIDRLAAAERQLVNSK